MMIWIMIWGRDWGHWRSQGTFEGYLQACPEWCKGVPKSSPWFLCPVLHISKWTKRRRNKTLVRSDFVFMLIQNKDSLKLSAGDVQLSILPKIDWFLPGFSGVWCRSVRSWYWCHVVSSDGQHIRYVPLLSSLRAELCSDHWLCHSQLPRLSQDTRTQTWCHNRDWCRL